MVQKILLTFCLLLLYINTYSIDRTADYQKAYGMIITGDIRPMLSFFYTIDDLENSGYYELYKKYEKRFIKADEEIKFDDSFITSLCNLYTTYWRSSLLDPDNENKALGILWTGLLKLAESEGYRKSFKEYFKGPSWENIQKYIKDSAKKRGYYLYTDVYIAPLFELQIWKKEINKVYEVKLPTESFKVNVVFMQDFLSRGWINYATFASHSGGWTYGDTVHLAGEIPEGDNELFNVNLAHEGQHISDLKRYKKLDQWMLEYRAKITQLLQSENLFWSTLNFYKNEASDNASLPHSYASYKIINDIINELPNEQNTETYKTYDFNKYSKERLKEILVIIFDRNTNNIFKRSQNHDNNENRSSSQRNLGMPGFRFHA